MLIDISRPLAEGTAVFPGDMRFSRAVTLSILGGDSCNVSAFIGSAHAGTHVDLPFHFSNDVTIPDLSAYIGPARVIEVSDWAILNGISSGIL